MQVLYEALLTACDAYQAMQQAHLHCLALDTPLDMERLVFERDRLFADLQNHLAAVAYQWQKVMPDASPVQVLQARLAALLEDDARLAGRLYAYRITLENHRAQLRQGQKVLACYSGPVVSQSPCFVDRSG